MVSFTETVVVSFVCDVYHQKSLKCCVWGNRLVAFEVLECQMSIWEMQELSIWMDH